MALFASAVAGGVECASDEAVESVPCPFVSVASVEPSLLLDVVSLWGGIRGGIGSRVGGTVSRTRSGLLARAGLRRVAGLRVAAVGRLVVGRLRRAVVPEEHVGEHSRQHTPCADARQGHHKQHDQERRHARPGRPRAPMHAHRTCRRIVEHVFGIRIVCFLVLGHNHPSVSFIKSTGHVVPSARRPSVMHRICTASTRSLQ